MSDFKDRLKELRKEKGLTQQEVADFAGRSSATISRYESGLMFPSTKQTISKYENGKIEPSSIDTLVVLAKFFDVTTDYLLGVSDVRKVLDKSFNLSSISNIDLLEELHKRLNIKIEGEI